MKALSGHRVYLTSAINRLTVMMLRGECEKEPTLWQQDSYIFICMHVHCLHHTVITAAPTKSVTCFE